MSLITLTNRLAKECEVLFAPPSAPLERVGVELELFPVFLDESKQPVPVPLGTPSDGSGRSLMSALAELGKQKDWRIAALGPGHWEVYLPHGNRLSFEPGGQLEIVTKPLESAGDTELQLERTVDELSRCLASRGIHLCHCGVNPWHSVQMVGLQCTKPRYRSMYEHFGRHIEGRRMMTLTCSLQTSLDYGTPDQAFARWRAANLLAGVLTATFANSPLLSGRPTEYLCYRSVIWQKYDQTREALRLLSSTTQKEAAHAYLQLALDANVIFANNDKGNFVAVEPGIPFRALLDSLAPQDVVAAWRTHLSTLFPPVTPRSYLEIRYIDCPLRRWMSVPTTLLCSLLYDDDHLSWVLRTFEQSASECMRTLDRAARLGLHDPKLHAAAKTIFSRVFDKGAHPSVSTSAIQAAQSFFQCCVEPGVSQADMVLEAAQYGERNLLELVANGGP